MKEKLEEIIRDYGLYSKLHVEPSESDKEIRPEVLLIPCYKCKVEKAFQRYYHPEEPMQRIPFPGGGGVKVALPDVIYKELRYICTTCETMFYCWLEIGYKGKYIRKVGQYPPYEIAVPVEIRKELGDDANLYQRALISISHGFGIGACIYLRRILENQVNPLLEMHLSTRKSESAAEDEIIRIKMAIEAFNFDEKIRLISKGSPEMLPDNTSNPITLMYSRLSDGVHNKTDEECVEVARHVRTILTRLLVEMRREQREKQAYINSIKALDKKSL